MKRITLFSTLTPQNKDLVLGAIFPDEIENKRLAYMPSEGVKATPQLFIDEWQNIADKYNASFTLIDNTSSDDVNSLLQSNILIISGGNTFTLLNNLRQTGLDQVVKRYISKSEFSLAGYSAGAIVLTPSIEICNLPDFDTNTVRLDDMTGLSVVDFEIFPHYDAKLHRELLAKYQSSTKRDVKPITDNDLLSINL